jgi:hypothetical protein
MISVLLADNHNRVGKPGRTVPENPARSPRDPAFTPHYPVSICYTLVYTPVPTPIGNDEVIVQIGFYIQ